MFDPDNVDRYFHDYGEDVLVRKQPHGRTDEQWVRASDYENLSCRYKNAYECAISWRRLARSIRDHNLNKELEELLRGLELTAEMLHELLIPEVKTGGAS